MTDSIEARLRVKQWNSARWFNWRRWDPMAASQLVSALDRCVDVESVQAIMQRDAHRFPLSGPLTQWQRRRMVRRAWDIFHADEINTGVESSSGCYCCGPGGYRDL